MVNTFGPLLLALFATGILAGIARLIMHHREVEAQRDDAQRRNEENMTFLTDFTSKLGTVEEIPEALQLVAHHIADECDAESLAIFVEPDSGRGTGTVRGVAVTGPFPTFRPTPIAVQRRPQYRLQHLRHESFRAGETAIGIAVQERRSVLVESYADSPARYALPPDVHTFMAVPMIIEGNLLGVVCAANRRTIGKGFTPDHLDRLERLSSQAALASNLVRIYAERSNQQRLHQEMAFGRDLQQRLLPSELPSLEGCRFAALTEPAREVGGDYYDFIPLDGDRMMVVVADASGKGVSACMLMAMCRAFVRCLADSYSGLEEFLMEMNQRLYTDTANHLFVTLAIVVIDTREGIWECGCAGHTPFLLRLADGRCVSVEPEGAALGMYPNEFGFTFETLALRINPGTQLLIHTDGITEACNEKGDEFGFERLLRTWEEDPKPADAFVATLREQVQRFAGQVEQYDDQTVLVIDFVAPDQTGAPPAAPKP